jgi:protein-S-isoprenylcysteine O-methyltransferase Ste14
MWWRRALALYGVLPGGATFYFALFWGWFDFWRRHRVLTYALMFSTFTVLGGVVFLLRDELLPADQTHPPAWVQAIGWIVIAGGTVLGTMADRQIGLRVRSFTPFFDEQHARIRLRTTGAYGVVRHPIYASGLVFQIGIVLVTGYVVVLAAAVVFAGGAAWFTAQEERRLVALLDDPSEYDRYRARVPALLPRLPGLRHK